MIRWLGRVLLLRVLPRRLLPVLTVVEVAQLLRAARRQRRAPKASPRRRPGADPWKAAFTAHRDRARSDDVD